MTTQNIVKQILINNLNLNERMRELKLSSPLLGAIPELDSMAVVGIITSLEESFDITVHDDEISANSFETFGSLVEFVERKLNE
jgi:acyl carrier protein